MQKQLFSIFTLITLISMISGCTEKSDDYTYNGSNLLYNQVGYLTHGPKMVLVSQNVELVKVINHRGRTMLTLEPQEALFWEQSGDSVRKVDFSQLKIPGTYHILLPNEKEKYEITISDNPYREVGKAALKAFYYNRTALAIEPRFGGKWARQAGHPDTLVYVHASAAGKNRPEGFKLSSPLGWYDAGDYNKYIVNSGITTYTLFRALADYHNHFNNLEVNIPETGTGVPDLLSETLFNYRWMLTMQDPNDGGVYHKLTNKNFDGVLMPHEATDTRYVVAKSTAAALNFAAVAAQASRILKEYDPIIGNITEESLQKAELAWEWAMKNPTVIYRQPQDVFTGAYGDFNLDDEFFWASAELFLATGNTKYLDVILQKYNKPQVPTWNQVYALGFMSLFDYFDELPAVLKQKGLKDDFLALINELTSASKTAPYGVSINHFEWGSNSSVANEGMLKLYAYRLTQNKDFLNSAIADMDYILGRNATGYCFVTGFGHKKVMNIHHRPSEADGIDEPVPGFLVGGPNTATFADCPPEIERNRFAAKSFVDHWCSYSTNEIAINWNAPLVYLTGGIDALTTK